MSSQTRVRFSDDRLQPLLSCEPMRRFEVWLAGMDTGLAVKEVPAGTRTAVDAALAVGCDVGQIVKSLVFVAGGRPVVALVSGANRLDEKLLAAVAGGAVAEGRRRDGAHRDRLLDWRRPAVRTRDRGPCVHGPGPPGLWGGVGG